MNPTPQLRTVIDVDVQGYMLTLEEAKRDLGVVDTGVPELDAETDANVQQAIAGAHHWCEETVYRTFRVNAKRELHLQEFANPIYFADPPLISVDSVKYTDEAGNDHTVDPTHYAVTIPTKTQGRLYFRDTFNPYGMRRGQPDNVRIEYTSGYASTLAIPNSAKQACLMMLSFYYDRDRDVAVLEQYERAAFSLIDGLDWGAYT